jgi:phenylalanyl-tRNA synthetase beta chain
VPPTRSDILHAVDVIEDVAIAYGYNNLPVKVSRPRFVLVRPPPSRLLFVNGWRGSGLSWD